jgi:CheY-like chemotaxis protein
VAESDEDAEIEALLGLALSVAIKQRRSPALIPTEGCFAIRYSRSEHCDHGDCTVPYVPLAGHLILVVEDEPLVALGVEKELRAAGARVIAAGYVELGLSTVEHPRLSAAVVDLKLDGEDGTTVCQRLRSLGVPFVVYTGNPSAHITGKWPDVPVIHKPATTGQIVASLLSVMG